MTSDQALTIFREALWLILTLAAPLLLVSVLVGLLVAIFQAATQIHEQTLTFVPKIIAIAFLLLATGSWMIHKLMEFFQGIMDLALLL